MSSRLSARVDHRRDAVGLGRHREHHVQEVLGVGEVVARVHERLADRLLVRERRDGARLRQQPHDVGRHVLARLGPRVVGRQRRHHRRQHRHRVGGRREAGEEVLHVLVQQAVVGQLAVELGELGGGGQVAVDEQVADLGEGGLLGDLLDRIAAIAQDAALAVDEGDGALAGAGVAVAGVVGDRPRLRAQRADVDADLALAAHRHRQLVLFAVEDQSCRAHAATPARSRRCNPTGRIAAPQRRRRRAAARHNILREQGWVGGGSGLCPRGGQTPRAAPQSCLWSCSCRRTGSRSRRIHSARVAGSSSPATGEKCTGQRRWSCHSSTRSRAQR